MAITIRISAMEIAEFIASKTIQETSDQDEQELTNRIYRWIVDSPENTTSLNEWVHLWRTVGKDWKPKYGW